ncbi:D-xylulose reductase [Angomonas deanei]|nr:D-xylulose reductase [Angomonas deanei]|eukprot:EPY30632.1 D-xylulose reductase [Angomonas deanei]
MSKTQTMKALVMESKHNVQYRDITVPDELGPDDCRVRIHSVGICGSDVHYVEHGGIGDFIVKEPMILGHEASGTVTAVGSKVRHLQVGDRVALEPGIPRWTSPQTLQGLYNVDPDVVFFATPPVHGCTRISVIHPAALCFKLPAEMSFAEGAMCEPLSCGLWAVMKAKVQPGQVALVLGAGTIGLCTALSALASGCSEVIIADLDKSRLQFAKQFPHLHPVNSANKESVLATVRRLTADGGVNCIFECTGAAAAYSLIYPCAAPGATCVITGMPPAPVPLNVVAAQAKEITFMTTFRYRNTYPSAIQLIRSGRVNVKPLISATYPIEKGMEAYKRALERRQGDVKIIIQVDNSNSTKL